MTTTAHPELEGIGRYEYGWADSDSAGASARRGLSEEVVRVPVLSTCPADGVVLDPFAGSGTTLLFAQKTGRRAIGIDLKREFCAHVRDALEGVPRRARTRVTV